MRRCLGERSCMSSPFSVDILNSTFFFRSVKAMNNWKRSVIKQIILLLLLLVWDHVRGDIDNPCDTIANFCVVIAILEAIGGRAVNDAARLIVARLAKHKTLINIVKHRETHVKHSVMQNKVFFCSIFFFFFLIYLFIYFLSHVHFSRKWREMHMCMCISLGNG